MKHNEPRPDMQPGQFPRYGARVLDDSRHDPYAPAGKYPAPSHCTHCGAVYMNGRWQWVSAPEQARSVECPACRREKDAQPAGTLTLQGDYVATHRLELIALVRNEARQENAEHPMHRIMHVDENGGRIEITTTDIHLPARIGAALKHAHGGELHTDYASSEYVVRARWER